MSKLVRLTSRRSGTRPAPPAARRGTRRSTARQRGSPLRVSGTSNEVVRHVQPCSKASNEINYMAQKFTLGRDGKQQFDSSRT